MLTDIHASSLSAPGFWILMLSTAGVAVAHTLAGPDHYLPFIVMGRARRWSFKRTVGWTTLCGVGHVASSVFVALGAVVLGFGLERVELIETFRGNFAAWAMIAFGGVYLAWGVKRALRCEHDGHGELHRQGHTGIARNSPMDVRKGSFNLTPWILFTIFVLGPCEPMIPLVMYPAAQGNWMEMTAVVTIFTALTVGAMLVAVCLARRGLTLLPLQKCERYTHAFAGGLVLCAGCAIQFLGL